MSRSNLLLLSLLAFGVLILAFDAPFAGASSLGQSQRQHLRVAARTVAPFVIKQGNHLTGFSVELWDALARRLNVDYEWVVFKSDSELIQAVQSGNADVAIAAITMTPEREKTVDFSTSYFDSGLQILVHPEADHPVLNIVRSVLSPALFEFFAAVFLIALMLAHLIWLIERRSNPNFPKRYLPGILEGLWGVVLITATGEYGDREVPHAVKRIMVASMWLIGVVLIAQFTATVTSSLTVQQLQSSIQGPGDLPGKTIATAPGSIAADYLTNLGIPFIEVTTADEAYNLITKGQVQAIVFDAPTLQYWAATKGKGTLQVVGPIFRPEKYGMAVATGSPLRKQINEALLQLYEDGTYEGIYNKWFSPGS